MNIYRTILISTMSLFLVLLGSSPFIFKLNTVGKLVVDPSSEHHLYIEQYDLDLVGLDKEDTTYFFLPAYVNLTRIDQTLAHYKVLCEDGTLLTVPKLNTPEPIYVTEGVGESMMTPWNICFLKSENIYSAFIKSSSRIEDITHDEYMQIDLSMYSPTGALAYNKSCLVKGRGNASWNEDFNEKNSFQIKLDTKSSLCGLASSDKWALLSNKGDASKILNKTAFDIGKDIGLEPVTDSEWLDLYFDGEYVGNYLLCKETDDLLTDNNVFLIEKNDVYYEKKRYGFKTAHDAYTIKLPKRPDTDDLTYIKDYICTVDSVIYGEAEHRADIIDSDSFVRWYIINELFFDPDALITSCFFYKYRDGVLHAGPLWDFDSSVGEDGGYWLDYTGSILNETTIRFPYGLEWYGLLYEDKSFRDKLSACYEEFLPKLEKMVYSDIDRYYEEIASSLRMDSIIWGREGTHASTVPGYYDDPYNNIRFTKYFLGKRMKYLAEKWGCDYEFSEMDVSDGSVHMVRFIYPDGMEEGMLVTDGSILSEDKLPPFDHEMYTNWKYEENQMPFYSQVPVFEDVTYSLSER